MVRHIFIGDIQGCRVELEALLEALAFDPASDELHPVGDFVNRGPDSIGVLKLLRQLGAGGVLGNHDLHALAALHGRGRQDERDTLAPLLADPEGPELIRWLAQRPVMRTWPDWICVHGGLHPDWSDPWLPLANANPWRPNKAVHFATRVRFCDETGAMAPKKLTEARAPFFPWDHFWRQREQEHRTVVFGHWAMRGLVQETRTRGLDTGCVWGKQLTAWIAEEDRIVQVPARKVYAAF